MNPVRTDGGETTIFVLPDAPESTVDHLHRRMDRLLFAGYTFTSEGIVDPRIAINDHGAKVRVFLDGEPVAGPSTKQSQLLVRMADVGIDVPLLVLPTPDTDTTIRSAR